VKGLLQGLFSLDVQVNKGICAAPSAAIMRNISQLAAVLLLVTQVASPFDGNVADAAQTSTSAAPQYEVSLQTNTPDAVVITGTNVPNYDTDVLAPLRAAQAEAAATAAAAKARKIHVAVQVTAPAFPGTHADWMAAAGIASSDFGYVNYIIDHESGWGVTKSNYAGSGAYGLGQALPASKMAPYGSDYLTNPVTQLKWANAYAVGRYGSWANAYAYWLSHHRW
jgi:hypothetical protein